MHCYQLTYRKPLLQTILQSSVMATALAGLFTTVVGGYLLDRSKANSLEIDRARSNQEALVTNQLQVLETLNKVLAEYKLAAEFVIYDLVERDGATLENQQAIIKSITEYDHAARAFLNSAYGEVFRVRIYFANPQLSDQLERHMTRLNTPRNLIAIDAASRSRSPNTNAAPRPSKRLSRNLSSKTSASPTAQADTQRPARPPRRLPRRTTQPSSNRSRRFSKSWPTPPSRSVRRASASLAHQRFKSPRSRYATSISCRPLSK